MSRLTELADVLDVIARSSAPLYDSEEEAIREAAAILRAADGQDVAGLMAMVDAHGLANYREGLDDKIGTGADSTDVTIKRTEIESALRLALAAARRGDCKGQAGITLPRLPHPSARAPAPASGAGT